MVERLARASELLGRDYVTVILQGGTVEVTTLPGTTRTEEVETGSVAWRTKTRHDSKNTGGRPVGPLTLEIK